MWATFVTNLVTKTFKNNPIWSHWIIVAQWVEWSIHRDQTYLRRECALGFFKTVLKQFIVNKIADDWIYGVGSHCSTNSATNTAPENTHLLCYGKNQCTVDLQLDWFEFDLTCKSLSCST